MGAIPDTQSAGFDDKENRSPDTYEDTCAQPPRSHHSWAHYNWGPQTPPAHSGHSDSESIPQKQPNEGKYETPTKRRRIEHQNDDEIIDEAGPLVIDVDEILADHETPADFDPTDYENPYFICPVQENKNKQQTNKTHKQTKNKAPG